MPSALPKRRPLPLADLRALLWKTPFDCLKVAWNWARQTNDDSDLCLVDRYFLLTQVLHRPDAFNSWLYDRCREVERSPDGYIDIWAREHYKSTIITFAGIIQEVLRDPEITVGIFSHTNPIATAFLGQIKREFESNEDLRALFPDIIHDNPERDADSWSLHSGITVKRRSNPKEATIEAHGLVDGQPTSRHFKLMVYDDVVTDKSVYTPEQIFRTTEAWSLSDNLGSRGGRKWYIGTRYHFADTYSEIIKKGAAVPRIYKATDNGKLDGNPVFFTMEQWERKKKEQLESTLVCQMLADPLEGKQRVFDVRDLGVYEVRPLTLMVYILIDPARSVKPESANTAMVVIGLDSAGNKYLLDGYDHKMDLLERWERIRSLWRKWRQEPGVMGIHVGYERFGAISDLDYFKAQQRLENTSFDIVELEWPRDGAKSKLDRVQRLVPDIRGHKFYLPYETDPEFLTSKQREFISQGYEYRVAKPIFRRDENNRVYDLSENFKMQVHAFPFGDRVDVVDAASRLYDIDPVAPQYFDGDVLEPEYT